MPLERHQGGIVPNRPRRGWRAGLRLVRAGGLGVRGEGGAGRAGHVIVGRYLAEDLGSP